MRKRASTGVRLLLDASGIAQDSVSNRSDADGEFGAVFGHFVHGVTNEDRRGVEFHHIEDVPNERDAVDGCIQFAIRSFFNGNCVVGTSSQKKYGDEQEPLS